MGTTALDRVTDKDEVIRLVQPLKDLIKRSKDPWRAAREVEAELRIRRLSDQAKQRLLDLGFEIWEIPGDLETHDILQKIAPERGTKVLGRIDDLIYFKTNSWEIAWSPDHQYPVVFDPKKDARDRKVKPEGLHLPGGTCALAPLIGELVWLFSEYKIRHGHLPKVGPFYFSSEQYELSYRGAGGYDFSDGYAGRHAVGSAKEKSETVVQVVRLYSDAEGKMANAPDKLVLGPIIVSL